MKLQILSDLHNEFGELPIAPTDADVIVLAGDTGVGLAGLSFALERWRERPIIYIAGNHEYYGQSLPHLTGKLRRHAAGSRVYFLENESAVIDGVRFLGCTLWSDFKLFGESNTDLTMEAAELAMMDYHRIRKSPTFTRLRARHTAAEHARSRAWLAGQLAAGFDGPTIIVTHHAPSIRSIAPQRLEDPISAAYASNLEELIRPGCARLWIHGHTHFNVDYEINGVRVLTNQRGYPDERAGGFRGEMVVEV